MAASAGLELAEPALLADLFAVSAFDGGDGALDEGDEGERVTR